MSGYFKTNDTEMNGDSIHQLLLLGLSLVIAACTLASVLPAWSVRSLVTVAFVLQISFELKHGHYAFLKSPVFLLSAIAFFGYSLFLSIAMFVLLQDYMNDVTFIKVTDIIPVKSQHGYLGLKAEMYVIAFATLGLCTHIATDVLEKGRGLKTNSAPLSANFALFLTAVSLALTLTGLTANYFDIAGGAVSHFLSGAYPPVQAFIIILLLHLVLNSQSNYLCFWIASFTAISFMLINYNAKIPLFLIFSITLFYISNIKINIGVIIKYTAIILLIFILLIELSQILRSKESSIMHGPNPTIPPEKSVAADVIVSKTVWRQLETGNCFQNILKTNENAPFEWQKQLFWIRALIPRIIWPGKENLSLGSSYSTKYCDIPMETAHSSSITLLGQPTIMGGNWGLILHGGILLIGLGGLTLIARRYPGIGSVYAMALLPWWIDFDQDFALYVANIVKFSIFMSVVAIPIMLSRHVLGNISPEHK